MEYIKIERKKLVCAAALLFVVATAISSIATSVVVREGIASRIRLEGVDMKFDNARCESVAFDTSRQNAQAANVKKIITDVLAKRREEERLTPLGIVKPL